MNFAPQKDPQKMPVTLRGGVEGRKAALPKTNRGMAATVKCVRNETGINQNDSARTRLQTGRDVCRDRKAASIGIGRGAQVLQIRLITGACAKSQNRICSLTRIAAECHTPSL